MLDLFFPLRKFSRSEEHPGRIVLQQQFGFHIAPAHSTHLHELMTGFQ